MGKILPEVRTANLLFLTLLLNSILSTKFYLFSVATLHNILVSLFIGRYTHNDLIPEGYNSHHHYDTAFQTVPSSVPPSPDQWPADLSHGTPNGHHTSHQTHPAFAPLHTRESPLSHLGHVQNASPAHVQQGCDVKPVIQAAVLAG